MAQSLDVDRRWYLVDWVWHTERQYRDFLRKTIERLPSEEDTLTPDPVVPEPPAAPLVVTNEVESGVIPTRKLIATAATMVVLYVVSRFTDVDEELEQIINLVVPLIVAYVVPNDPTPGGAPDAKPKVVDLKGE